MPTRGRFSVFDVETANAFVSSICQVGVVTFEDGEVVDRWGSLVNPEDHFLTRHVRLHGITPERVADAPLLADVLPELSARMRGGITVSHTGFDRLSLRRACHDVELAAIDTQWLDSARMARRAWPQDASGGYALATLAAKLGIPYARPHDAVCDAETAGRVALAACVAAGRPVREWVVPAPALGASTQEPVESLEGETVVFTGVLNMPRDEAAERAAAAGGTVAGGVTRKTTLLVVGDQDLRLVGDDGKSNKQEKAEQLMAKGQPIRILGESDFLALIARS